MFSRATINRLANDHSKLKRDRAEEIARILGASVEDLMLNKPPRPAKLSLVSSFDPDAADDDVEGDASPSYSRDHWQPTLEGAIPRDRYQIGRRQWRCG
jgi:hypothetical protein